MPQDELDRWLRAKTDPRPAAQSLSMLDGFIAAIVAGPLSLDPLDWICPLLGVGPDAFNHGGTADYAAISAVVLRHNAISEALATEPKLFQPLFAQAPNGDVDPGPWARGFHAAMKLNLKAWSKIMTRGSPDLFHLLPILAYCTDDRGQSLLHPLIGNDPIAQAMARELWPEITISIQALRRYWMPTRFKAKPATRSKRRTP
ncbi:UPF0149 family protein [Lichenifustis flavocetrariae]|uniref:UPF0149 family protein n=1 Tax=Lichenifustis flavocetrariae TaxID=2949735 RepID=A0AA41Z262_9HYPH|nr:UPF0149 family protein [Lichenifustis flavocetrariae]MCW6512839.1 UPF0149 family protein [Lichenifustis flavocetrariae]